MNRMLQCCVLILLYKQPFKLKTHFFQDAQQSSLKFILPRFPMARFQSADIIFRWSMEVNEVINTNDLLLLFGIPVVLIITAGVILFGFTYYFNLGYERMQLRSGRSKKVGYINI